MCERCPTCGQLLPPPDDPTAARVAEWEAICAERGYVVAAGRVSESVAAELLGLRKRQLAGYRLSDRGPRWTNLPVRGSQLSYALTELAAWVEYRQEGESWT